MATPATPFIFLHIPKTGGVTFHAMLRRQYAAYKMFNAIGYPDLKRWLAFDKENLTSFDLVRGHLGFEHIMLYPKPAHRFTFLRNSRQRIISHYFFLFQNKSHWFYNELHARQYTLKDILTNGIVPNFDNCMVRFLCGNKFEKWGTINEGDLERAIYNLDTYFEHFGLVEYYDETLLMLSYELGWMTPNYLKLNEGTKKKPDANFDAETNGLIDYCGRYDSLLYDFAEKKFKAKLTLHADRINIDLPVFKEANKNYRPMDYYLNKYFGHKLMR
jgi:hypothetical protein